MRKLNKMDINERNTVEAYLGVCQCWYVMCYCVSCQPYSSSAYGSTQYNNNNGIQYNSSRANA